MPPSRRSALGSWRDHTDIYGRIARLFTSTSSNTVQSSFTVRLLFRGHTGSPCKWVNPRFPPTTHAELLSAVSGQHSHSVSDQTPKRQETSSTMEMGLYTTATKPGAGGAGAACDHKAGRRPATCLLQAISSCEGAPSFAEDRQLRITSRHCYPRSTWQVNKEQHC